MKNRLNIFSDQRLKNFLTSLLSDYELFFMELKSIDYSLVSTNTNVIILNNKATLDLINFQKLKDNYLVISNLNNKNTNTINNFKLLKAPTSIDQIKNKIKNLTQNLKVQFHDICLDNEKLINLSNNSFCYLTKIELEILSYLINEKKTNKAFIKENILNIKANIETNSLESHLTRIRKKMIKIKTRVKIYTKSDKLLITI